MPPHQFGIGGKRGLRRPYSASPPVARVPLIMISITGNRNRAQNGNGQIPQCGLGFAAVRALDAGRAAGKNDAFDIFRSSTPKGGFAGEYLAIDLPHAHGGR
jgi:hypothetical protein